VLHVIVYFISALLYPSATPPQWVGPVLSYNSTYNNVGPFVDFHFICRIIYETSSQQTDDGARFDVALVFDSQLTSVIKTTTSAALDVVFTSQDIKNVFGNKVGLASLRASVSAFISLH